MILVMIILILVCQVTRSKWRVLGEMASCRNPDMSGDGVWCYVAEPDSDSKGSKDKKWEYCKVPWCDTTNNTGNTGVCETKVRGGRF